MSLRPYSLLQDVARAIDRATPVEAIAVETSRITTWAEREPEEEGTMQTGITLKITDKDGNAFAILGFAQHALREAGIDPKEFLDEATAGSYDDLLATVMRWFIVD